LIINESTSYPGTLRNFVKPLISKISKFNFEYASAPERIDPANPNWNLNNTPRLVSGLTRAGTDKALDFYRSICSNVHEVSQPEVAEAAKLFENTFRQINIALVNEFAIIAKAIGFSAHEAIEAASTKPFGFMPFYPSIGVGGHCIPVDPSYLSYSASKSGTSAKFIELANNTNLNMARYVVQEINSEIKGGFDKKRIQIAGISYKPEVSDMREAPALRLIQELKNHGAYVTWHDPVVKFYEKEKSSPLDPSVDVGIIVTPHKGIDYSPWKNGKVRVYDLSANSLNYGWPKFF
jgi:UDP-N-acetyl-D-glucosamine dehydrogenase